MFTKGRYCRESFEPKRLSVAPKTIANFLERKTPLYEQGATFWTHWSIRQELVEMGENWGSDKKYQGTQSQHRGSSPCT